MRSPVYRAHLFAAMLLSLAPAVGLLAQSAAWSDPETWKRASKPIESRDILYTAPTDPGHDPKAQLIDVYQSTVTPGKKSPVLVYIHGGAWNHGERPKSYGSFRGYVAAGFSVINVEYRFVDAAPAPAAVQDVRCVLSWINSNAAKYNFDTSRVVTYGTSAGGHLAMMAGFLPAQNDIDTPQCKAQPKVVAVLDFYGPYHLEPTEPGAFKSPSTARWMGPDPQPSLLEKEHAMSPSTYVRTGIPPVFIAHGDADPTVPYLASETLKQDLDKAGVKSQFRTVTGGKHGGWTPEENQSVQLDALKFLQSVGVIK